MKCVVLALGLFLLGCAPKKVQLYAPQERSYGAFYHDEKGSILILRDSSQFQAAIDELCKTPCAVEHAGEMIILTNLDKGKKK